MKALQYLAAAALLAACSAPGGAPPTDPAPSPVQAGKQYTLLDLPNLDDNVHNDTLLVYTTHDAGNGLFVMAARNVDETRDGLRLYLYRPKADSSAEVLACSKPAFDSSVMLPTFFSTGDTADGLVILANYGERESWGQNAFWLKDGRFKDLGWLDVTRREWKNREDSVQQWRVGIAPYTQVNGHDGQFTFTFNTDSVQLYDDLEGHTEVMLPAARISYRYNGKDLVLVVDGQERHPRQPL